MPWRHASRHATQASVPASAAAPAATEQPAVVRAPLPTEFLGDGAQAAASQGIRYATQLQPRLSVLMQYFKMSRNIRQLARWRSCPDVELLVHVDSREVADLAWLNTTADHLLFDPNVHEIRGYNSLARIARAPLIAFVQDDMPPPSHCDYLQPIEQMMSDDPALAAIGWRTWSLTPMNYRWGGAWGQNPNTSRGALRFERRVGVKLSWWNGSPIRAQYAALVDVGPLFMRKRAFLDVGGYNEGFSVPGSNGHYHDWEFSTRLWLSGWRAAFQETRFAGVTCVCFECVVSHACVHKGCERDVAAGHIRMRANYNDVSLVLARRREEIMRLYKRFYDNISYAVGHLNTRLAASNGFVPYQEGALVKWMPGPTANRTQLELGKQPRCHPATKVCCNVWGDKK